MLFLTLFLGLCAALGSLVRADDKYLPSSVNDVDGRFVFAHFIVGNTYPYTKADWVADIIAAQNLGIDGFALDLGTDSWEAGEIALAFSAAHGTGFKLFLSFDMSTPLTDTDIVNYVKTYASDPNYYYYKGKPFVSTFAGETLTFGEATVNAGWQHKVKDVLKNTYSIDIWFVPSWTGLDANNIFTNYPVLDGMFS